ncbi:MAG TPA: hypothetical protein VGP07_19810 [Polyangia bacterium]|jgi:hypothetical protein
MALAVTVTPSGAIVVGGIANGNATFWTGQPDQQTVNLPTSVNGSMFLARVSTAGALTWLRTAGNSTAASVTAVAAVGEDVMVAGTHGNAVDDVVLAVGEPSETHLKLTGMFLARYRSDGTMAWARPTGGNAFVTARQIALTPQGGVVAVGSFSGSPTFGPGETHATTLQHNGGNDSGFIARFEPDGSLSWALPIHDAETIYTNDYNVAVKPDGTILLGISYNGSVALPGSAGTGVTLTPSLTGTTGFAIACYESDGRLRWARTTGGRASVQVRDLIVLEDGSAVASGQIQPLTGVETDPTLGQATFGLGEPNQTTLSVNTINGVLAKYDANGGLTWVRQAPAAFFGYDSLAELPDHRIVVAGTFGNYIGYPTSATFGPGEPGQVVISWLPGTTTANGMYTFLAWYNADGSASNARSVSTAAFSQVTGVTISPDKSAVLCGAFSTQVTFGPTDPTPLIFTHGPMSASITQDAYLAKFAY